MLVLLLLPACGRDPKGAEEPGGSTSDGGSLGPARTAVADLTSHEYGPDCLTSGCHQQLTRTRWVHGPVSQGACLRCHLSNAPLEEHRFEPAAESHCFSCHEEEAQAAVVHDPYGNAQCTDCHDPHGGSSKNLINADSVRSLCQTCHAAVVATASHLPAAEGDCTACHDPHASEHPFLLKRSESELCASCHVEYREFLPGFFGTVPTVAHVHSALLEEGCGACHDPHGSVHAPLLKQSVKATCRRCHESTFDDLDEAVTMHKAFEQEDSCVYCHSPHASIYDALLKDLGVSLCLSCHDEPITRDDGGRIPDMERVLLDSEVLHGPLLQGNCRVCHLAHFSPQRALLRDRYPDQAYAEFSETTYELCFQCHDRALIELKNSRFTWFRDGERNLHYVHVNREKGRTCDICHESHGSSKPRLVRASFPFGPGRWPMPINYVKTGTGGSCTSACHEVQSYDNSSR